MYMYLDLQNRPKPYCRAGIRLNTVITHIKIVVFKQKHIVVNKHYGWLAKRVFESKQKPKKSSLRFECFSSFNVLHHAASPSCHTILFFVIQQQNTSGGLGFMSPRISSPAHPASGGSSTPSGGTPGGGGRGRGRGAKRDTSLIGETVKIVGGPFKGKCITWSDEKILKHEINIYYKAARTEHHYYVNP